MKRKRSQLKKAREAVDKAAASFIKAGIMRPEGIILKLGGQRPTRWKPPPLEPIKIKPLVQSE